jgi:hypothetical protein
VPDATARAKLASFEADAIKASDGYVFTAPVGQFKPNSFGLHARQAIAGKLTYTTPIVPDLFSLKHLHSLNQISRQTAKKRPNSSILRTENAIVKEVVKPDLILSDAFNGWGEKESQPHPRRRKPNRCGASLAQVGEEGTRSKAGHKLS